ncbi:TPA: hypothetical protein KDZ66_003531 [Vibrio vulnificus]|nr:hypothetical protein [Vibrio vulnificus]
MLKPILSIFAISIATSFQATASTQIDSKDAPFHEGEDVIACGLIKQVSRFKRGFYLNMDERYPRQSLTLVVWEDDVAEIKERHGSLERLEAKRVCAEGRVTKYKGRSQISLYNSYSLKLQ